MNKYIEVLCKQNPKMSLPCSNANCKREHEFKSKDIFKNKVFKFKCTACGKETEYDTTKAVKDFESQMKAMGVVVK